MAFRTGAPLGKKKPKHQKTSKLITLEDSIVHLIFLFTFTFFNIFHLKIIPHFSHLHFLAALGNTSLQLRHAANGLLGFQRASNGLQCVFHSSLSSQRPTSPWRLRTPLPPRTFPCSTSRRHNALENLQSCITHWLRTKVSKEHRN